MHRSTRITATVALATGTIAGLASAQVAAELVVLEGAPLGPGVATVLNNPFVTVDDVLGFTGAIELPDLSDDRYVWVGDGPAFFNSELPDVTGNEFTMGISSAEGFCFSPAVAGNDSVIYRFLPAGATFILSETDPAPGLAGFFTFASRPKMTDGGLASWVSGINETDGAGATQFRALYSADEAGNVVPVVVGGDMVTLPGGGMIAITAQGIDFDYSFSPDGARLIHAAVLETGSSATDGAVVIDGTVVVEEGSPIDDGSGENWDNFDIVQINDDGTWAFSGDTDGATTGDEFIAVDGVRVVREGDTLDGVLLDSGSFVRGFTLGTDGAMAHAWDDGPSELLFFTGDVSDVAGTTTRIVGIGDLVDTTGDGVGDYEVTDVVASTGSPPGVSMSADAIYLNLDVIPVGGTDEVEGMFRFVRPDVGGEPCPADFDGDGDVGFGDLTTLLANFGGDGPDGDVDGDGDVDFDDIVALLAAYGPCP